MSGDLCDISLVGKISSYCWAYYPRYTLIMVRGHIHVSLFALVLISDKYFVEAEYIGFPVLSEQTTYSSIYLPPTVLLLEQNYTTSWKYITK